MTIPTALDTNRTRTVLVPALAVSDLRHEWILTSCVILAIAAVITPLLLLLGLKHGLVEWKRYELVQNPYYREIRPIKAQEFSPEWLAEILSRDDVASLIPNILRGASSVTVIPEHGNNVLTPDMLPTIAGDPLLIGNGIEVPQDGECVVSASMAEKLALKVGDEILIRIGRREGRLIQERMQVVGILPVRADVRDALYATLSFAEDVETFRDGHAIRHRNWPGGIPRPYMSFDGMFVTLTRRLSVAQTSRLTINTGFISAELAQAEDFTSLTGLAMPATGATYKLAVADSTIQLANLNAVFDQLRGLGIILLPYVDTVSASIMIDENMIDGNTTPWRPTAVTGLSLSPAQADQTGMPFVPWGALRRTANLPAFADFSQALVPETLGLEIGSRLLMRLTINEQYFDLPFEVVGSWDGERIIVPIESLGQVNTSRDRRLIYEPESGELLMTKSGYRGFRMYANRIEDVSGLHQFFLEQKIDVDARLSEIGELLALDRALTRLFWLVAIVGVLGGIAAMVASLYAAVERKRRAYGMLRLMGLSKGHVSAIPVIQAICIALLSISIAIGGFFALSFVINTVFAADLPLDTDLCYLPADSLFLSMLITTATAIGSSLLGAFQATRIDPAEAIREE